MQSVLPECPIPRALLCNVLNEDMHPQHPPQRLMGAVFAVLSAHRHHLCAGSLLVALAWPRPRHVVVCSPAGAAGHQLCVQELRVQELRVHVNDSVVQVRAACMWLLHMHHHVCHTLSFV